MAIPIGVIPGHSKVTAKKPCQAAMIIILHNMLWMLLYLLPVKSLSFRLLRRTQLPSVRGRQFGLSTSAHSWARLVCFYIYLNAFRP